MVSDGRSMYNPQMWGQVGLNNQGTFSIANPTNAMIKPEMKELLMLYDVFSSVSGTMLATGPNYNFTTVLITLQYTIYTTQLCHISS